MLLKVLILLSLGVFLSRTSVYAASVTLAWDDTQVGPVSQYSLWRQLECQGVFVLAGKVRFPTKTMIDGGVEGGKHYCWYVKAENASGQVSLESNMVLWLVPQRLEPRFRGSFFFGK